MRAIVTQLILDKGKGCDHWPLRLEAQVDRTVLPPSDWEFLEAVAYPLLLSPAQSTKSGISGGFVNAC